MRKLFAYLLIAGSASVFACSKHSEPNPGRTQTDPTQSARPGRICIDSTRINPGANCAAVYAPVCGCDGKTYPNACEATKAGVVSFTTGPCATACIDSARINPSAVCTTEYNPVCGCNGKTYSNPCEAAKAGVRFTTPGTCPK